MLENKRIVCIIPARLESSRFPRKVLAKLLDKPLLQWVWLAARKVSFFDDVFFAIDSELTANLIGAFGGKYIMTSPKCASGTNRVVEIALSGKVWGEIWVCWQADEPFITSHMIEILLQNFRSDFVDVWTLKKKITDQRQILSPQVVKVVCDVNGNALYFSRSPIPFYRDIKLADGVYYKHIGIYAYTTSALKKISSLEKSALEGAEKLEQLRALEAGMKIGVAVVHEQARGIDTPEDLSAFRKRVEAAK